ncbi:hypothetical protein VNO78_34179 [Psophocarpus tetragonolobus]|uniref:Uncharacterized protein n=1 Tax=Psophocarpus tetragonolobus TaxID=3891 RepID=A0AAN9P0A8_PSOTE
MDMLLLLDIPSALKMKGLLRGVVMIVAFTSFSANNLAKSMGVHGIALSLSEGLKETQVKVERMRKPSCDVKDLNKGAWSKQEDQKLIDYINKHGEVCWRTIPQAAGLLRCGKSCRLRWINYLRPDLKRGNFDEDEEDLIIKLHALLGNRWSLIAGRLPGRTDNEVKNYWNSHIRRKLISKGIDPNNHRLNHKITSLIQNPPMSDDNSKSFDLKDITKNHGEVSDVASGEAESSSALPDLNLDLSIAVPSSSLTNSKNNLNPFHESNSSRKLHLHSPSTLLLFQ